MEQEEDKVFLGLDTGGTYTDAVLFSRRKGVLAKAKALTTRHDLSIGIAGAVNAVFKADEIPRKSVSLVSLSTTLATNSLVEGKGGSVGLVMIGFEEADLEKAGLKEALGTDPVVFISGGHDVHGNEKPLDLDALEPFLDFCSGKVGGFAIAGMFAVRNHSHEAKVGEYLQHHTGLPVTCSHELSSKLGGPKRALTTLLNARLIPVIHDLVVACRSYLAETEIDAPLMVVRGDGTLVHADFAQSRPIETILSGPAASLIGAQYLLGMEDAVVSDIGGTTTDVAILEKGWPRIAPDGASVAGHRTMVEAVAMHTYGLGGDSVVSIHDENPTRLQLGPRRQIPVSLLSVEFPDVVNRHLRRQSQLDFPSANCTKFVFRKASEDHTGAFLKPSEEKLLERLSEEPQALDLFLRGAADANTLNSLVSKGLAIVSGFTPSDAMHVLEVQNNWDVQAANMASQIFCKMRDRFGDQIASSGKNIAENVKSQLVLQSSNLILETCMLEDGMNMGVGARALLDRSLEREPGFIRLQLALDRPLVGLGASAHCYYPAIGERINTECIIPDHADVANAIGAVTSKVRVRKTRSVTSPNGGLHFHVPGPDRMRVFEDEEAAITSLVEFLKTEVVDLAATAGAVSPIFETDAEIQAVEIEGGRHFVEAKITVTATGEPSISS